MTAEKKAEAAVLIAGGATRKAAAQAIGVHRTTVQRHFPITQMHLPIPGEVETAPDSGARSE